jgi:hypothetical protein
MNARLTTLSCLLLAPLCAHAADLPKQGTFAVTAYMRSSVVSFETTPKHYAWTWDDNGIAVSDAGSALPGRMAVHCVGSGASTNAEGGVQNAGHCVYIDVDGDRFTTNSSSVSESQAAIHGEAGFGDGSGKYAGIQGKFELTTERLPHSDVRSGSLRTDAYVMHLKGSYTLTGSTP